MGNGQSALHKCLDAVCGDRIDCVGFPNNPLYQISWVKPYNLQIEASPVAVFRPNTAQDVADAVKCATASKVHVQAKSGGHSYGNYGLGGDAGGLMIDLENLNAFAMDTTTWHATFGSGYRLGDLDKQLHSHGKRAMAHGVCPGVGIGGHATIGGIGPVSRMWGTSLDHVLEVEVVTADGKILRANEKENSDLFWALRGAGASYGIITEFVVKTHPEPGNVVEYTYSISVGSQDQMAPLYRDWQALVGDVNLDRRFSSLFIVEPLGALVTGTFFGTHEEYEASGIPQRLPSGGTLNLTATDWLGSLGHIAETAALYVANLPTPFASNSLALRKEDLLDDNAINNLFKYMGNTNAGTLLWAAIFDSQGGAISDVPDEATAYPHRDKLVVYQSYAVGIPRVSDKTFQFIDGMLKHVQAGAPNAHSTYAGYIDVTLNRTAAQQLYWGDKLPRLREVKKKWDPNSVFHNPQSVDPA